jgi:hypothetical protein
MIWYYQQQEAEKSSKYHGKPSPMRKKEKLQEDKEEELEIQEKVGII